MPNPSVDNSHPSVVYACRGNIVVPSAYQGAQRADFVQTQADTELESRLAPITTASVPLPQVTGKNSATVAASVPND